NIYSILLTRHPIAASLSRKKVWESAVNPSYWGPKNRYFLNSDYVKNNFLTPELEKFLKMKNREGTILEKFIISWCLENLPLINKIHPDENNNYIFLTYEDLLMNSQEVISYLSEELNLPDKNLMLKKIRKPSSTVRYSDKKTRKNFKNDTYNKDFLLKKWKKDIPEEMEKKIFDIIDKFEIDIYKKGRFMPVEKYLIGSKIYSLI
ncbi:MAG: sulfotransferase domain-containing protein, partial [bacterium]